MPKAEIKEKWIAQAYQHGVLDGCTGAVAFETEAEAIEHAKDWTRDIPNDEKTEHEMVIFKAVATYRGRPNSPVRYDLK